MCICIYLSVYVHIYTYIHTYILAYIHTFLGYIFTQWWNNIMPLSCMYLDISYNGMHLIRGLDEIPSTQLPKPTHFIVLMIVYGVEMARSSTSSWKSFLCNGCLPTAPPSASAPCPSLALPVEAGQVGLAVVLVVVWIRAPAAPLRRCHASETWTSMPTRCTTPSKPITTADSIN